MKTSAPSRPSLLRAAPVLLMLSLILRVGAPAGAFVQTTLESGGKPDPVRWPDSLLPIPFELNDRSLALLPNLTQTSVPADAIQNAFRLWTSGSVSLYLDGTTPITDVRSDGTNLITFADTASNRSLLGGQPWRTFSWSRREGNHSVIEEADIVFGRTAKFATDGTAGAYDLQAVLAHEVGHVLGLDDSPIPAATMYPLSMNQPNAGRSLHSDDIAGLHAIYGGADPQLGTIAGEVLAQDNSPIFGASVVAVDQDGIVQVGALTDRSGYFLLSSLPAGDYQLYAEPLDGPGLADDLDGAYHRNPQHPVQTAFRTSFAGGNASPATIHLGPAGAVAIDPIRVDLQKPALNPLYLAWSPDGTSFHAAAEQPLQIRPGETRFLVVVGSGLTGVPRTGFTASGSDLTLDDAHAARGTTTGNLPFVLIPVTARLNARPGARSLYATGSTERAAFTAGLEVISP